MGLLDEENVKEALGAGKNTL